MVTVAAVLQVASAAVGVALLGSGLQDDFSVPTVLVHRWQLVFWFLLFAGGVCCSRHRLAGFRPGRWRPEDVPESVSVWAICIWDD